jgi:hypothetical protein
MLGTQRKCAAIKQTPRRIPLAQRKEVEDEIDKMLDNNVIVPSHSPWASPLKGNVLIIFLSGMVSAIAANVFVYMV